MKNNLIVAITGQSGSGKSTVSSYYAAKGYTVIDCDLIAREIHNLQECKEELVSAFGNDILKDGRIERSLLGEKAFADDKSLQKLTDITHPFIIKEILNKAQVSFAKNNNPVFVDGAVIIGHEFEKHCDEFIVVVAKISEQVNRISKRDNIDIKQAAQRISRQTPYALLLEKANYVINNNANMEKLIIQSEYVLRQIIK